MNATAQAAPEVRAIPLEQISLGENYRHRHPPDWDAKLRELGESMKQNGQLEPVLVRPSKKKGADFEIVFGERRYHGARRAGLETLLCIVRDVPDAQVLELQLAENDDRDQPHPLDEAEAFAELLKRGATPASIAAIRGRSERYVRERLELAKLHPKALAALDEGRILLGHALLIARVPEKLQAEALKDLEEHRDPLNLEEAGKWIQGHYMLKLATAPFDRADAELVPKAGPCTTCPKRSGNQGELFHDVKSPDVCTDPTCYRSKLDARWKTLAKTAKAEGKEIVPQKAAGFDKWSPDYVRSKVWETLDGTRYIGMSSVKVRTLAKDAKIGIAQNPHTGAIVELVRKADVDKAARSYQAKKASKKGKGSAPARDKVSPAEKARREKQKLEGKTRQAANRKLLGALASGCEAATSTKLPKVLQQVVLLAAGKEYGSELAIVSRREGADDGESIGNMKKADKAFEDLVTGTDELGVLVGVLLEATLFQELDYPSATDEKRIGELCKLLKIDRSKLKAEAVAELKAKQEAEKAAAPPAEPKAKKPAKRKKAARR